MLLSGDTGSIAQRFTIRLLGDNGRVKEFLLIPKGEESLFEELRLSFSEGVLAALLLADSLGQRTSIELFNVRLNPDQVADRFTFTIPKGVDVIRQ